uniref:glycylpeptide N-tetradecanoyltransferase n=1 Tax=Nothobranchius furzeri TaxID=105023 RepID=A0A8C6NSS8_NOTFU
MAEDSESAASQQSLELDDQDTCGIDGDNEEEIELMQGSPGVDLGAKRKKKKQKREKKRSPEIKNPGLPIHNMQYFQRAMELLSCQGPARRIDEAAKHRYRFWDTQPVPKLNEVEPYSLPQGFMWDTLDLGNADVLKELYMLLNENYVEDDYNMFRCDYSPSFLRWALRPPGWLPQWHCGVRVSSNRKLVGFISAIPADIRICDTITKMVEINCIFTYYVCLFCVFL